MADQPQLHLILAFFDKEEDADRAAEALQAFDKASEEVKYGAIGVLVKGPDGRIKEHKMGPRVTAKGVGIGVLFGLLVAAMPGVALLGGIVGFGALGGLIGTFTHKGLGLFNEDLKRYSAELDAGHAAVGVMADESESKSTVEMLQGWGGRVEAIPVSDEALATAKAAADAADAAAPAPAPEKKS
jgi:uncharacterized membrane protein